MKGSTRRRIAVTGAAGRVGQRVCASLLRVDADVVAIDRVVPARPGAGLQVPVWRRDAIEDAAALASCLDGCDAVIHLAGAVPGIGRGEPDFRAGNVWTTAAVAEAAARAGAAVLVLASTAHVYGSHADAAIAEQAALHPVSAYAKSKVAAEQVAAAWAMVGGAAVVLARLGNLYGFLPSDETVIGRLVGQARRNEHFRVRSVSDVRDFTHVADAAEALARLALRPPHAPVTAVNVSTGVGVAVSDVVGIVQAAAGRPGDPVEIEEPTSVGSTLVMRTDRLVDLVGVLPFRSVVLGVSEMLREQSTGGGQE